MKRSNRVIEESPYYKKDKNIFITKTIKIAEECEKHTKNKKNTR